MAKTRASSKPETFISSKPKGWKTPFPSVGEVVRSIANVLETKGNSPKDFDRLARGEFFDHEVIGRLWEDVFNIKNELQFGKIEEILNKTRENLLKEYIRIVREGIPYGCSREQVLNCLVKRIAYIAYYSIKSIMGEMNGLLHDFIVSDTDNPISMAFKWKYQDEWENFRDKLPKQEKENIYRWMRGEQVPDMGKLFYVVQKFCDDLDMEVDGIYKVFFCAKIIYNLKQYPKVSSELCNLSNRRIITLDNYEPFGKMLSDSLKNEPHAEKRTECFSEYAETSSKIQVKLCNETHSADDKDDLSEQLEKLEKTTSDLQDIYVHWWYTQRLRAYWYVLSGNWKKAMDCYEEIIDVIFYVGGDNKFLRGIFNEIAVLAAIRNNRPLMKRIKQKGVFFGLFAEPFTDSRNSQYSVANDESRSGDFIIEDSEAKLWASKFYDIFRKELFFIPEKELPPLIDNPLMLHYIEGEMPQEADARNKDKIIELQGIRWPQLVWFAIQYKTEEVEKLLNAGADVNKLSSSGESALLIAVRNMNRTILPGPAERDIRMFEILSGYPHKKETLEAITNKKHLSVLGSAVETGNPDIVKKVLEMMKEVKAKVDIKYHGESGKFHATPLYVAVSLFIERDQDRMLKYDDWDGDYAEFIRRTYSTSAEITTEQTLQKHLQMSARPLVRQVKEHMVDIYREIYLEQYKTENLLKIIGLLLAAGSNPNEPHSTPDKRLRAYTPLMLAAEFDLVDAFDVLVKAGGDVNKWCEHIDGITGELEKRDCWKIALRCKSHKILQYLEKNCKGDGKLIIL
ncbi:MAG: hypothetical protein FWB85_08785 [Chitinispirillia bacterium]|nr:hypothetical protein [Chitinispirillia bacterium]